MFQVIWQVSTDQSISELLEELLCILRQLWEKFQHLDTLKETSKGHLEHTGQILTYLLEWGNQFWPDSVRDDTSRRRQKQQQNEDVIFQRDVIFLF